MDMWTSTFIRVSRTCENHPRDSALSHLSFAENFFEKNSGGSYYKEAKNSERGAEGGPPMRIHMSGLIGALESGRGDWTRGRSFRARACGGWRLICHDGLSAAHLGLGGERPGILRLILTETATESLAPLAAAAAKPESAAIRRIAKAAARTHAGTAAKAGDIHHRFFGFLLRMVIVIGGLRDIQRKN